MNSLRLFEAATGLVDLLDAEIAVASLYQEAILVDCPEAFCCSEREWTNARIFAEVEKLARKQRLNLDVVCTNLCLEAAKKHGLMKAAPFGSWSAGRELRKDEKISIVKVASLVGFLKKRHGMDVLRSVFSDGPKVRLHLELGCVLESQGVISLAEYFSKFLDDESFWSEVEEFVVSNVTVGDGQRAAHGDDPCSVAGRILAAFVSSCTAHTPGFPLDAVLRLVQRVLEWSLVSESKPGPRLLNPFSLTVDEKPCLKAVPEVTLREFVVAVIENILTGEVSGYKPVKLKTAIASQRGHNYGSVPPTYKEVIFSFINVLGCEGAIGCIQGPLRSEEINWSALFSFVVCLLAMFGYEAKNRLDGVSRDLLREGCESNADELKIAGLLLARQLSADFGPETAAYLNYERWWREVFCKKEGFMFKGNFLVEFKKLLSKIVPCEPLEFLKVQVNNPPPLSGTARQEWIEYELLAKTRVAELGEAVFGAAEPKKTSEDISGAVASDVNAVAEEYVRKGEIPFNVSQMKIFRAHYYQLTFLPELLKPRCGYEYALPAALIVCFHLSRVWMNRVLPKVPDARMKLIEALLKANHIKPDAHAKYLRECDVAAAGLLNGGDDADDLMAQMNAQAELDALAAALNQFENALKMEAREGRLAELLLECGKKMKQGFARLAPESKAHYVEVDLSVDLLGTHWVSLAEFAGAILDCVARCAEYFEKKEKLVTEFRKLHHLKGLLNVFANEKAASSVVHLMSLRCFACEDFEWNILCERVFSADRRSVVLALGLVEGWMRASTDALPSVKLTSRTAEGRRKSIVDSFSDGIANCLSPGTPLHIPRFLRWVHGLLIPQLSEGGSVLDAVPKSLAPIIFFALDFVNIAEDSPLASVRDKLRESSWVSVEEWLNLQLGAVTVNGVDNVSTSADRVLSNLISLSSGRSMLETVDTALLAICRRSLADNKPPDPDFVMAVSEAYQLGLVSSEEGAEDCTPVFLDLWRRLAESCGSTSACSVDKLMFGLWNSLPAWVLTCNSLENTVAGVNVDALLYLLEHNWSKSFVDEPDFILSCSLLTRLMQAMTFGGSDSLQSLLAVSKCLPVAILYHWDRLRPVILTFSSRSSALRSLASSLDSARGNFDVTAPSSQTSFDLFVAQTIFSIERAKASPKLTVAWLNAAPPGFIADLAISLVVRVTVLSENEDLGSLLGWLAGEDCRSKVSARTVALCEGLVKIFDANQISKSWPSLRNFFPRCPPGELPQNPSFNEETNLIFPLTPKAKFMLPCFKLACLIKFFQQKRIEPHYTLIQAWIFALWEVNKNVECYFAGKRSEVQVQNYFFSSWLHGVERETEKFLEATERSVWGRLRDYARLLDEPFEKIVRRKGVN